MVLELFNNNRLVHPGILYVLCEPWLMTHLWQKVLTKDADLTFKVEEGALILLQGMHKPLLFLLFSPSLFAALQRTMGSLWGFLVVFSYSVQHRNSISSYTWKYTWNSLQAALLNLSLASNVLGDRGGACIHEQCLPARVTP